MPFSFTSFGPYSILVMIGILVVVQIVKSINRGLHH